ncbi:hypothetical protein Emed_002837 [Eimeria media]
MAESFSSALRLGGLDDYLSPAQDCVLPLIQAAEKVEEKQSASADAAGLAQSQVRHTRAAGKRRAREQSNGVTAGTTAADPAAASAATPAPLSEAADGEPQAIGGSPAGGGRASSPAHPSTTAPGEGGTAAPANAAVSRVGKIALSDCLSCSGCLTSAEGVLLSQQSATEFFSLLSRKQPSVVHAHLQQQGDDETELNSKRPKVVAISLSSQSIAAVSLYFGCTATVAAGRLSHLFRLLGADFVFSMATAEDLALLETQKEFAGRLLEHRRRRLRADEGGEGQLRQETESAEAAAAVEKVLSSSGPLPLITSYCPGLVLYAEKSLEAPMLAFLSRVRSAQQIQGLLCKSAVRVAVEATAFLLALKAHAWPSAMPAAFAGAVDAPPPQAANSNPSRRSIGAPWELLQVLLTRSPYGCYAGTSGADDQATGAAATAAAESDASARQRGSRSGGTEAAQSERAVEADSGPAHAAKPTGETDALTAAPQAAINSVAAAGVAAGRQVGGLTPDDILHVCVMPCFDKKLEAARHDFTHGGAQQKQQQVEAERGASPFLESSLSFGSSQGPWAEVDMVLATSELPLLLEAAGVSFDALPCASLDCPVPGVALSLAAHSLRKAAARSAAAAAAVSGSLQSSSNEGMDEVEASADAVAASVQPAREAAAKAEQAAEGLPPTPHAHLNASAKCKEEVTTIARPTAILAGSGGYLEYLFVQTARGFFKQDLNPQRLEFVSGPNEELQSLAVLRKSSNSLVESQVADGISNPGRGRRRGLWSNNAPALLRGAFAYGFRNIQNVAQQLRVLLPQEGQETEEKSGSKGQHAGAAGNKAGRWSSDGSRLEREIGTSIPHIVEVGACPGGCLNGGGQTIAVDSSSSSAHPYSGTGGASNTTRSIHKKPRGSQTGEDVVCEPKIIGKNREPLTTMTRLFHADFPLMSPQSHPLVLQAYAFLFGCCYGEEGGVAAAAALGQYETLLQENEAKQMLQSILCNEHAAALPLQLWLAPRVTAIFRTDFRTAKTTGKSGLAMSLSDLKW